MEHRAFTYYVGETTSDEIAVFSTQEPLFCYICRSEEEAVRRADDTFASYLRLFPAERRNIVNTAPVVPVRQVTARAMRRYQPPSLACA